MLWQLSMAVLHRRFLESGSGLSFSATKSRGFCLSLLLSVQPRCIQKGFQHIPKSEKLSRPPRSPGAPVRRSTNSQKDGRKCAPLRLRAGHRGPRRQNYKPCRAELVQDMDKLENLTTPAALETFKLVPQTTARGCAGAGFKVAGIRIAGVEQRKSTMAEFQQGLLRKETPRAHTALCRERSSYLKGIVRDTPLQVLPCSVLFSTASHAIRFSQSRPAQRPSKKTSPLSSVSQDP